MHESNTKAKGRYDLFMDEVSTWHGCIGILILLFVSLNILVFGIILLGGPGVVNQSVDEPLPCPKPLSILLTAYSISSFFTIYLVIPSNSSLSKVIFIIWSFTGIALCILIMYLDNYLGIHAIQELSKYAIVLYAYYLIISIYRLWRKKSQS
ncbi:MAG TPA: hypothetical protein DCZ94_11110 [Lentisphaeria bacterium]|nr:MAG: hypothetical protein A2X48_06990 [Lentisphaerae bacterium GWF2_49_21]HBC87494.1 hypothetical protein [Lentisphaeria bacterium]